MQKFRKILFVVAFLVTLSILLASGYQVFRILSDRHESQSANEALNNLAVLKAEEKAPISTVTELAKEPEEKTETEETQPPVETVPVTIDFAYLQEQNEDVAGWIYCGGTPISYPFLQSNDNSYYLYRLLDGTNNPSGSLFLDFRNSFDMSDWNSIIYGHNMHDGSMFASLNEYKKQEYYDEHPTMYLITPEKSYRVDLIAGIFGRADSTFYDFPVLEEDREAVVQGWLEQSTFETKAEILPDDRFVTLSTCTYEFDSARYVVIGALREVEG